VDEGFDDRKSLLVWLGMLVVLVEGENACSFLGLFGENDEAQVDLDAYRSAAQPAAR
jgi:hypothetical protein